MKPNNMLRKYKESPGRLIGSKQKQNTKVPAGFSNIQKRPKNNWILEGGNCLSVVPPASNSFMTIKYSNGKADLEKKA